MTDTHEMRWEYVNPATGGKITKGTFFGCTVFMPAEWTAIDGTVWRFNGRARYDE